MKVLVTAFLCLLLSQELTAQKLTGIWRGYFSSGTAMYQEGAQPEMYKYEIQFEQLSNNGIKGVTFSYKTTVFYGKAAAQGIYNVKSKTLLLKETGLLDLKIGDKSEPCLMTCYLDYSKMGKLEVLQGTFISTNMKDKGDCGSGKVYLEKVPTSDFKKEAFLTKKNDSVVPKKVPPAVPPTSKPSLNTTTPKPLVVPKTNKPTVAKPNTAQPKKNIDQPKIDLSQAEKKAVEEHTVTHEKKRPERKKIPLPKVLRERENDLVKIIVTDAEYVQIDLFDNGTIDNDTITVYHNNELVVRSAKLNVTPITIKIKNTPEDNIHELVIVADNLGDIPPNTALMVITAGKKRYEVFLSSNEMKNAKVIIEYQR